MNARIGDLGGREKRFTSYNQCGNMERLVGASHLPGQPNQNGSYEDHAMATRPLPSPEVLRQLLRYEPETGKLFWKDRPVEFAKSAGEAQRWNKRFAGREIVVTTTHGYKVVTIFDKQYPAHRICFALHYGKHPQGDIDHINGIRTDNRLSNLREATKRQNATNRKLISRNASGVCGVSITPYGTYSAYISTGEKRISLGSFKTVEEAATVRRDAETKYGYSKGHGRSA